VEAVVSGAAPRAGACAALCTALAVALQPGCGEESRCARLPECDISARDCQGEVLAIASCMRGRGARAVPVRVVDFDDYVEEAIDASTELAPEQRRRRELYYAGLALLDLAPSGLTVEAAVEQDVSWVGAFYSSEAREIAILDRGDPLDGVSATALLLHEFVHALQDDAHDTQQLYEAQPGGRDGASALSALFEGEAVLHTDHALADTLGYEPDAVDWDDLYRRYGQRGSRELAWSESPLIDVDAWFVYAFGARFVHEAYARGGQDAVLALYDAYDAPPTSARQIALGPDSAEPDGGDWLAPELDLEALPPAPEGFELVESLHLGAYLAHLFASRRDPVLASAPLPARATSHLRADVLTVQAGPDDELLVSWRLRFARRAHADDFLASIARPDLLDASWVHDRDAFLIAATEDALLPAVEDPEAWRPLPEDEPAPPKTAAAALRTLCRRPP
jgi:hypothetical protein